MQFLTGFMRPLFPYASGPLAAVDLPRADRLRFVLGNGPVALDAAVIAGAEVKAGAFLAKDPTAEAAPAVICPVDGSVKRLLRINNLPAVEIAPGSAPATRLFEPLIPATTPVDRLWRRMAEAGVRTASPSLRPIAALREGLSAGSGVLVILAFDREPGVCSATAAFRERPTDAAVAAAMLHRMLGTGRCVLAVLDALKVDATKVCASHGVEVLSPGPRYPDGLPTLLAMRFPDPAAVRFITVETALAALDAVEEGIPQHTKLVTFIGPEGSPQRVYRVPLGTCLLDVFAAEGLSIADGDEALIGGPLAGVAQPELDVPVDESVDAVTYLPHARLRRWRNEPCVSCGACLRQCPTRVQPQLIARYAEYSLFDRMEEFGVHSCIECGLCAVVCPASRPLLQWIRLARQRAEAPASARS